MNALPGPSMHSWFRSRGGRRFGLEFALIVIAKAALLAILWYAFFAPQPRPDTSPGAIERHLLTRTPSGDSGHD